MAKRSNQTLKALFLRDILFWETNEEHPLTAAEMEKALARYGITAERKSIYEDIEKLTAIYGLDVEHRRGRNGGYYVASREFELSELKLLVDVVQSCRFITEKKSRTLIEKLEKLTDRYTASQMQHQVYIHDRVKSTSEIIYYAVDILNSAINTDRQVSFKYLEYTVTKQKKFRHNGKIYQVSPYALHWDDANYYLVSFDDEAKKIKHFRVDKMTDLTLLQEVPRTGLDAFPERNIAAYMQSLFGMYGGEKRNIRLRMHNRLINVIVDRFGQDVSIIPYDCGEDHFIAAITIQVSPQFYGWLVGLGKDVEILAPNDVRAEYLAYLQQILSVYPAEKKEK